MGPAKKRSRMSNGSQRINEGASTSKEVVSPYEDLALENVQFAIKQPEISIQCTKCQQWRSSRQYFEKREVPEDWECQMWIQEDGQRGSCTVPGETDESKFTDEPFPEGTVVWAKLGKYPHWPGMVESNLGTKKSFRETESGRMQYNVTFFGSRPSYQWVFARNMKSYEKADPKEYKNKDLKLAIEQGNEAFDTNFSIRIWKYSISTLRPELRLKARLLNGQRVSVESINSFDSHSSQEQQELMDPRVPISTNGKRKAAKKRRRSKVPDDLIKEPMPGTSGNAAGQENGDSSDSDDDLPAEGLVYKAFLNKRYPPKPMPGTSKNDEKVETTPHAIFADSESDDELSAEALAYKEFLDKNYPPRFKDS